MTSDTRIDAAPLTVLLDLRNPACYLALGPAAALESALDLEINWLPLAVPPLRPPSDPGPNDDRSILHRRHRACAIAREIETYGRAQGLVLRELYRDPDPEAFNLGWLWLRDRHPAGLARFLRDGFRAYWSVELDPSNVRAIALRVAAAGGDRAAFEAWCRNGGPDLVARVAGELRERGLIGVPGYLIDGEFFQGRQHLPMIRWILGGRKGPGPI